MGQVHQVLQHHLDNQLYVKTEKCEFHVSKESFLGFVVLGESQCGGGLATPTSRKQLTICQPL